MGNPVNLMGFRTTQETNLCIGLGGCFQGASQGKTHSDCGRRRSMGCSWGLNREEVASGTPAFIRLLIADIRCNVTRHLKLLPPRFPHHSALLSLLTLSQNKPFLLQVAFSTIFAMATRKSRTRSTRLLGPSIPLPPYNPPPGSRALHIFLEISLLFTWDLMVLTFTEVKLCFFLAFKVGKVVKLRFLGLFASIGVLQEREREQKNKVGSGNGDLCL